MYKYVKKELELVRSEPARLGSSGHGILQKEYWSQLPFLSPGDLPDPRIEPWSPALQADSLPTELPGRSLTGKGRGESWTKTNWIS